MILPGRDVPWGKLLRKVFHETLDDNIIDYAGSVTYSAFLAIFPFLLFLVALASLVINPSMLSGLLEEIHRVAPPAVAQILSDRLTALTSGTRPTLLTVSAVLALWTASGAVAALTTALNIAWDVKETRPFWKTRGVAILVTIAAAVLFIAASALVIVTPVVVRFLGSTLGMVLLWLRWPVAGAIMLLVVACLYRFLPNVKVPFQVITPGALTAVVLWIAASLVFSFYVGRFGNYEVVYGALGGVIVLLLWMWLSALLIIAGAEINATLNQLAGSSRRSGAPPD